MKPLTVRLKLQNGTQCEYVLRIEKEQPRDCVYCLKYQSIKDRLFRRII